MASPNTSSTKTTLTNQFAYAAYGGAISLTGFQMSNNDLDDDIVSTWAQNLAVYVNNAANTGAVESGSAGSNAVLTVKNTTTNASFNVTLTHVAGRKTIIAENPSFDPATVMPSYAGSKRVSIETSNGRGSIDGAAVLSQLTPGQTYSFFWNPAV
jgi:hypothetical protein